LRSQSRQLIPFLLASTLAACGPAESSSPVAETDTDAIVDASPEPDAGSHDDSGTSPSQNHDDPCSQNVSHLCPDGTCVAAPELCPTTYALLGRIQSVRPGTVNAEAPEMVEITVTVEEPHRLNQLIAEGASLSVELRRGEVVESYPIESMDSSDHLYNLSFTPGRHDAPRASRVAMEIVIRDAHDTLVGRINGGSLRFRGPVEGVTIDGRDGEVLDDLVRPLRMWSVDLDGDGIEDRLVLDAHVGQVMGPGRSPGLRAYRCPAHEAPRCEPVGTLSIPTGAHDYGGEPLAHGLITLDQVVATDDQTNASTLGFLYAVVTERTASGGASRVVVTRVWIDGDAGSEGLRSEQTSLVMPTRGNRHWPEALVLPRLFDVDGVVTLGVVAAGHRLDGERRRWASLHLDSQGNYQEFPAALDVWQGPEPAPAFPMTMCAPAGLGTHIHARPPQTVVVGVLPAQNGTARTLTVAPLGTAEGANIQWFPLGAGPSTSSHSGDPLVAGPLTCRVKDLDGDGIADLVVTVPDGFGRVQLYALRGLERNDHGQLFEAVAAPQWLLDAIDAGQWEIFRRAGLVYLHVASRTSDGSLTPTLLILEVQSDLATASFTLALVDQLAAPTGKALVSVTLPDTLLNYRSGRSHDRLIRKRPGRAPSTIAPGAEGSGSAGHLHGSRQLMTPEGIWFAADFVGLHELEDGPQPSMSLRGHSAIVGFWRPDGSLFELPWQDSASLGASSRFVLGSNGRARMLRLDADRLEETTFEVTALGLQIAETRNYRLDFADVEAVDAADIVHMHTGQNQDRDILIALVARDGRILATRLPVGEDEPARLVDTGLTGLSGDIAIWMGSLGAEPIIALGEATATDGQPPRTFLWSPNRGTYEIPSQVLFADVLGRGYDQIITLDVREGLRTQMACDVGQLLSLSTGTMKPGRSDWSDLASSLQQRSESFCVIEGTIDVVDLDADGCADLLIPGSRLLSSRCDGSFDLNTYGLPSWTGHITGGDGWELVRPGPQIAASFRTLKAHTVWNFAPFNPDGDPLNAPVSLLPFFDALHGRH
jgi:hypothetical protein